MEMTCTLPCLPARAVPRTVARTPEVASDEALMRRYGGGDDGAFRQLYARYRAPLMRFSQRLTGNPREAEEVFQETWIAVIRSRSRYSERARFVTWLFAIAHRRAADGFRRRARQPVGAWSESAAAIDQASASASDEPAQKTEDAARELALHAAITALPFEQREVFLLRAEVGLALREIAAITRTPAETTKSRLRYALRALRKAMVSWT